MVLGDEPPIRYAKSTDGHIAYQITGDGPFDLIRVMAGPGISVDSIADEPHWSRFDARLASFARFIRFDRRGVGLSDGPSPASPLTIEQHVADAIAVLDAVGSERAAIFGHSMGGSIAMMLSASFPDRASHLVLWHGTARQCWAPDYPWAPPRSDIEARMDAFFDPGSPDGVERLASLMVADPQIQAWWARAHRQAAGPEATRAQLISLLDTDVRSILPTITCPTLVLCRPESPVITVANSRYMAEHIAGARYVEFPGIDEFYFAGNAVAVLDEIEEFLTGARSTSPVANRVLTTILFSDIVASTAAASAMGDDAWRERLDAHDGMVRRQLERFHGREIKVTGDGFLAAFDGPARAIHCGRAVRDGARRLGLEVRVGVHTGEVELRGQDIGGIAVHFGQRVSAHADPSEVLVSRTVVDLVAGSGLTFTDRGEHQLKGFPGAWQLFAVEG